MKDILQSFEHTHAIILFLFFLLENGLIAIIGVVLGFWADGSLKEMRQKVSIQEILWTFSTIFFNSVVTLAGYELFKHKIVVFDFEIRPLHMLLDFLLLIVLMDLCMYLFHRLIHNLSFIYKYHDLHHYYNKPTAISLFVLHPIEVLGFGGLWLALISLFEFSFWATMVYLVFNVIMGLIGHLEKEFVPKILKQHPYLQWLATTSFHRDHHMQEKHNFGFYTSIWDRLFGTYTDEKC